MNTELMIVLRLVLATFLGSVIGFQREWSGKEAGMRTHMLIALAAALFTVVSIYGFSTSTPDRVAASVATGIGFIGAGVILHRTGGIVVGLTTAATIFAVSAVGMAAGAGLYWVAAGATLLVLVTLLLPHIHRNTDVENNK